MDGLVAWLPGKVINESLDGDIRGDHDVDGLQVGQRLTVLLQRLHDWTGRGGATSAVALPNKELLSSIFVIAILQGFIEQGNKAVVQEANSSFRKLSRAMLVMSFGGQLNSKKNTVSF